MWQNIGINCSSDFSGWCSAMDTTAQLPLNQDTQITFVRSKFNQIIKYYINIIILIVLVIITVCLFINVGKEFCWDCISTPHWYLLSPLLK